MNERILPGDSFRKQFDADIDKYSRAIAENPHDVASLSQLGLTYITLWCYGFIPHSEAIPRAEKAILQAKKVDEKSGLTRVASGLIAESYWQWETAEKEYQLAIKYSPDSAAAHNWYANYLYATSRFKKAYEMAEKAVRLSPDPGYKVGLGAISYFVQDFARLKQEMLELIADHPEYAPAYDWLGMACIQLGEHDNSIEVYEKAASLSGRLAEILGGLGHAYGIAGDFPAARGVLQEMNDYAQYCYVPPVQIAFVYAGLGDDKNTFRMLDRAYSEKSWELIFMRTEPWLEHLHNDQRFQALVEKIGFSPNTTKRH